MGVEIGDVRKGSSRPAITKHLLAKYPDIDGEKSRIYLRNAFRQGLKTEALVLARKEGKGAGSYKIAKVTSEKPKDVVKKKSEAPKKVPKKTAEAKEVKKVTPKKVKKGSTSSAKGEEVKTLRRVPPPRSLQRVQLRRQARVPPSQLRRLAKVLLLKRLLPRKLQPRAPLLRKQLRNEVELVNFCLYLPFVNICKT